MKVKALLATSGVAAVLALSGASAAFADPTSPDTWNCSDFRTQVKIVGGYDPSHLDNNNDGIGCNENPAPPTAYDLYSNLKDEGDSNPQPSQTAPAQLAHTGIGPAEHPVRWEAAGGLLVAVGGVLVIASRGRRKVR